MYFDGFVGVELLSLIVNGDEYVGAPIAFGTPDTIVLAAALGSVTFATNLVDIINGLSIPDFVADYITADDADYIFAQDPLYRPGNGIRLIKPQGTTFTIEIGGVLGHDVSEDRIRITDSGYFYYNTGSASWVPLVNAYCYVESVCTEI